MAMASQWPWSTTETPSYCIKNINDLTHERNYFSNSSIIHEEKTKEITTVNEVWICDPNYHKIW